MKLLQQVQAVYQLLNDDRIQDTGLLNLKGDKLASPIANDMLSLFSYRIGRADQFRGQSIIELDSQDKN